MPASFSNPSPAHEARLGKPPRGNGSRRIFIINRDVALTTRLSHRFRLDGWTVRTSNDGHSALRALQQCIVQGRPPNLIIVTMPMVCRIRWTLRTRLDRLDGHIPLVVATGHPNPRRCAKQINAAGYLAMPYDLQDIDGPLESLVLTGTRVSWGDLARGSRFRRIRRPSIGARTFTELRKQVGARSGVWHSTQHRKRIGHWHSPQRETRE
jgi:CheY-like chemotaxis protein